MEQREQELQQQIRSLRMKEATLSRTNSEISHRSQQLDTRLEVLENELSSAREQVGIQLFRVKDTESESGKCIDPGVNFFEETISPKTPENLQDSCGITLDISHHSAVLMEVKAHLTDILLKLSRLNLWVHYVT